MLLRFTIVCKKKIKNYDLNQKKTHWECVMQQNEQPQKFR
jgi:hypothetical protein